MLGQSQVRGIGPELDDVVGTRRKNQRLVGSSPEACRRYQKLTGSSPEACRRYQKLAGSSLGVHWELARMTSGVHRKKTKKLAGRSSKVAEKLARRVKSGLKNEGNHFFGIPGVNRSYPGFPVTELPVPRNLGTFDG
ncbi:hypothetical protein BHM03_00037879 [Ensete ventricosum]|nr:hypothetical protein BHM03_00037879 [Ensete ventricosum]